jgi:hypothetical protein
MGRLVIAMVLLGSMSAFGQLTDVNGLKKNRYGLYESSYKDIKEAILKYNYISDKNGADTTNVVYNVMLNPIDFAHFKNDSESDNIIVSMIFRDGDRYKIMFGEINGEEDRVFFDVIDEKGNETSLVYRKK